LLAGQRIVRAVADGTLEAVTSAEVVGEILHRFVAIGRPELGARMAWDVLDLFAPVLPITHAVMDRMPELVERNPRLAARDLVHVATCLEAGIGTIVSADRGLDAVGAIRRLAIDDPSVLAR
jgi:predicted nucleic acid-binding protein